MRSGKAKKQSKFMKFISKPIKILSIVRDFYMKSLSDCAGKGGYSSVVCPTPQIPQLSPMVNLSVGSRNEVKNDNLRELVRVVSKRGVESKVLEREGVWQQGEGKPATGASGVGRSYSVGVGRIGRIDEDKPCEFEEEEDDVERESGDLLCRRSKGHAARKRRILYSY